MQLYQHCYRLLNIVTLNSLLYGELWSRYYLLQTKRYELFTNGRQCRLVDVQEINSVEQFSTQIFDSCSTFGSYARSNIQKFKEKPVLFLFTFLFTVTHYVYLPALLIFFSANLQQYFIKTRIPGLWIVIPRKLPLFLSENLTKKLNYARFMVGSVSE